MKTIVSVCLFAFYFVFQVDFAPAADWPMWRYDAQRSSASPADLPANLALHWERQLHRLTPCWPDQAKMQFDTVHEPIVVGQLLIIGSSHDGSVTAYDTRSGESKWTFFAEGPIRFAPTAWQDRLFVVSDDGHLYCLGLKDGSVQWKFRGGPSDRKVLGNERIVSMWPARGAPVVVDGNVYFAAGIWPFMGVFLHALDAKSGDLIWTNDGDGSIYIKQPHNTDSFAGVAPQGALVAIGDQLLIPGGRSVPACYDRRTGKLVYYQLAENAKRGGGSTVAATSKLIFNGGAIFDLANEKHLGDCGEHVVFTSDRLYQVRSNALVESDLAAAKAPTSKTVDRKGLLTTATKWSLPEVATAPSTRATALIKAGNQIYVGSEGQVQVFKLPLATDGSSQPAATLKVDGTPASLIAADDKLFVSTLEGRLFCFGDSAAVPAAVQKYPLQAAEMESEAAAEKRIATILQSTGIVDGYCVLWGRSSLAEIAALVKSTKLRVVAMEEDATAACRLREALRSAGIGGDRVMIVHGTPQTAQLPPYFASLAIVPDGDAASADSLKVLFNCLRPLGGVAVLPELPAVRPELSEAIWRQADGLALLERPNALPGSGNWTHEHADAANTRVSKDQLVKAPLGLLWFGGTSNDAILPRHGHGPQPQVLDGRLFIEGMDILRAVDIYTGRLLWEASLPGIGDLYDNTSHQPGANASGTNYIATRDGIYVAYRRSCVVLDPATGRQTAQFELPRPKGAKEPPLWGYINVYENFLIGGADPVFNEGLASSRGANDNYSFSRRLVILDRKSGTVLWTADARSGFRHNAICIGNDQLFCIDRMSGPELARLKRRGEDAPHPPRLIVFDLPTGKELWSTEQDVFGTWLSYSEERDVLVESGRVASDTVSDEPKGMRAYQASTGKALWENKSYAGPAMLHHDTILMVGKACDLLTGAQKMREHPLSGEPVEWTWSRNYGCNTPMASEHMLTFRSGAAGFLDYCNDGGTGNFGGFRSSCSNNLVVAGGLLTAPDYTRTCSCSYQNQTSLALVPMPEVETWTSFGSQSPKEAIRRVGINLNAPGDRKSGDGTLWLEFPSVGGASPEVDVKLEPESPVWFRRHSSQASSTDLPWVSASGAEGLKSITVKLDPKGQQSRTYRVRLFFLEPNDVQPGERLFNVTVQDKHTLEDLDVVKEAGGKNKTLIREFPGVEVRGQLKIQLTPAGNTKIASSLLSGIEIQAEGW